MGSESGCFGGFGVQETFDLTVMSEVLVVPSLYGIFQQLGHPCQEGQVSDPFINLRVSSCLGGGEF